LSLVKISPGRPFHVCGATATYEGVCTANSVFRTRSPWSTGKVKQTAWIVNKHEEPNGDDDNDKSAISFSEPRRTTFTVL